MINNKIYQENKIKEIILELGMLMGNLRHLEAKMDFCEPGTEIYIDQDINTVHNKFNEKIKDLFIIGLTYIENNGSNELLKIYNNTLNHILNEDYNGIVLVNNDDDGETYYLSDDLQKIRKYLKPFSAFDVKESQKIGLIYLENILNNTGVIIKSLNKIPKNESEVYNTVKHVLTSTFPDYKGLTESFYKEAKHYKPDILIPSIYVAVEYKFAKDEKRLVSTIEEILIDVAGYANHPVYRLFYAVFYVSPGICDDQRFKNIWEGYGFPINWRPLLVVGV